MCANGTRRDFDRHTPMHAQGHSRCAKIGFGSAFIVGLLELLGCKGGGKLSCVRSLASEKQARPSPQRLLSFGRGHEKLLLDKLCSFKLCSTSFPN